MELAVLEALQHATRHIHVQNLLENIVKDAIQVMEGITVVVKEHVVLIQH